MAKPPKATSANVLLAVLAGAAMSRRQREYWVTGVLRSSLYPVLASNTQQLTVVASAVNQPAYVDAQGIQPLVYFEVRDSAIDYIEPADYSVTEVASSLVFDVAVSGPQDYEEPVEYSQTAVSSTLVFDVININYVNHTKYDEELSNTSVSSTLSISVVTS